MKFLVFIDLDSPVDKYREANQKAKSWLDEKGIEYEIEDGKSWGGHNGTVVVELKAKQIKYLVKTFGIKPATYC